MYLFPTKIQGKSAILEGITFQNEAIISSVVNPDLLIKPRSGALYHYDGSIRFKNGSVITIVGDDSDTLVGSSVNMLVVSEAAMVRKKTIDVLVPSVIKIGGRIILVSSPRYGSHFNKSILENTGSLLTSVLRADEIFDNDGSRIYSDSELEAAKSMMSIEAFRSEYMVDLASHNETSIYGLTLENSKYAEGFRLDPQSRIFISADLGLSDYSAFTFGVHDMNGNVVVLDHYRNRGIGTEHYINYVKTWLNERKIPQNMATMILPHDANNLVDNYRYLTSRASMWENAGFRVAVLRPLSVLRTIEITRTMIHNGRLRFLASDSVKSMMNIIKMYEWKTAPNGEILGQPKHGTSATGGCSDSSDSLEYLVVGLLLDEYERTMTTESGVVFSSSGNNNAYQGRF